VADKWNRKLLIGDSRVLFPSAIHYVSPVRQSSERLLANDERNRQSQWRREVMRSHRAATCRGGTSTRLTNFFNATLIIIRLRDQQMDSCSFAWCGSLIKTSQSSLDNRRWKIIGHLERTDERELSQKTHSRIKRKLVIIIIIIITYFFPKSLGIIDTEGKK